jgi:hypothetical protein
VVSHAYCTTSEGALDVLLESGSTIVAILSFSFSFSFCWRFRGRVAGRPGIGGIPFAGVLPAPVGRRASEFGFLASGSSSTSLSPEIDMPSSPKSILLCFSLRNSSTNPSIILQTTGSGKFVEMFSGVVLVSAGDGIPFDVVLRELTFDFASPFRFDLVVILDGPERLFLRAGIV